MENSVWSSSLQYPNAQPFFGIVETTVQALRLVHAARLGVTPRVIRRLDERERNQMIVSGAVFVFSAEESRIRRWTDGRLFSSSRIDGNFLVYRELNERRGGPRNSNHTEDWISIMSGEGGRGIRPSAQGGQYPSRVTFVTANEDGIKVGGLVKRTITVKIHGSDYHVISYHIQADVDSKRLKPISSRFDIMSLDLPPHIFTLSDFRFPPRLETGKDGLSRIVCEPGPFEPPNQHGGDQTTRRSLGRQRHGERHVSGPSLAPAEPTMSPSIFHGPGVASSNNRVLADSWQEQYDSEDWQTTMKYSTQRSSQASSSEGYINSKSLIDNFASTSQYQTQRWRPHHFPHYDSLSAASDTYHSSSQWQDGDGVQTSQMEQAEGHIYNRQMGEEVECVWLVDNRNDVQSPNSGDFLPSHDTLNVPV